MGASLSPAVMLDAIRREKDRRAASASLYEFVKQAWAVVEPGVKFVESWHIQVICEHLEAISSGDIRKLLINIPPRHSKSTIVSVMFPMAPGGEVPLRLVLREPEHSRQPEGAPPRAVAVVSGAVGAAVRARWGPER